MPGPFLTRYSGNMNINNTGKYGFLTGAVDYGFLFIDDKLVTSRRGMLYRARTVRGPTCISRPGPTSFEYFHGAAGQQHDPYRLGGASRLDKSEKGKVVAIPADVWRTSAIGHVACLPPASRVAKMLPDIFGEGRRRGALARQRRAAGEGAVSRITTPRAMAAMKAKILWDFGDGQTTDQDDPVHVYLRPGLYTVKLTVARPAEERRNRQSDLRRSPAGNRPRQGTAHTLGRISAAVGAS